MGNKLDVIVAELDGDRSARQIAGVIGRLITSGALAVGHPPADGPRAVPPARRVADDGQRGVAQPGRRRRHRGPRPQRHVRPVADGPGGPAALPPHHRGTRPLRSSTCRRARRIPTCCPTSGRRSPGSAQQSLTSSYLDHPVLPALEEELAASWPFAPEAMTVVDGAMDALDRVAREVAAPRRPGRRRAPDVPSAARPAGAARVRGPRRRRRRRRARRRRPAVGARRGTGDRHLPPAAGAEPGRQRAVHRAGRRPRRACSTAPPRWSSRTTTPTTSPAPRWSAWARGGPSARCTSAASPRATGRTCAWRPSAAPVTSSPRWPTGGCSGPDGRAGSSRRCCWSCSRDPGDGRRDGRTPAASTPADGGSSPTCSTPPACGARGADGINLWIEVADERSAARRPRRAGHRRRAGRAVPRPPRRTTTCASPSASSRVTTGGSRTSPPSSPTPPTAPPSAAPTTADAELVDQSRGDGAQRTEVGDHLVTGRRSPTSDRARPSSARRRRAAASRWHTRCRPATERPAVGGRGRRHRCPSTPRCR